MTKAEIVDALSDYDIHQMLTGGRILNLVSVIARMRGWLPLQKDEKMTVHFNGKEYEIKRTK